ncbi:MAG: hypothetical protein HXY38_08645 [Chloroflexi bacterium]|nr:hypothetical protein [Chloroflexota bacterium]
MKNRRGAGCILAGALLALALCAVAGGLALWRSSNRAPQILVEIKDPQTTMLANLNEALPLVVTAEASAPITRLEVYANGVLIAASNGEGQNTTMLAQTWAPATVGRHALVARAFLDAEHFADSQIIFVDALDMSALPIQVNVDDLPRGDGVTEISVSDLAAASGTTPDELVRLNPSLSPAGSIPPGSTISIPRPAPAPSSSRPVPPPAPGGPGSPAPSASDPRFEGETHSCSQIAMRWSDAADETSYRLYRLAPGEVSMSLLTTLPANTTSYNDTPITRIGTYRYFLAPVRSGGEGITSMLAIAIGSDCSPSGSAGGAPDLRLSLISLTTQEGYDGVYCYISINGSRYERLPAGNGLLRPTSGNLYYDLPLQMPNRGQYSLAPAADGLVRLEGECWGRRGVESVRIGRFAGSHASGEWDGRDLTTELAFEPREVASLNPAPPAAGGKFIRYRITPAISSLDLTSLYDGVLQIPPDILEPIRRDRPTIPPPTNVRIVNRSMGMCSPLPEEGPNIGTILCEDAIIRSLAWDWSPTAEVPQAAVTGFMVITSIEDTLSRTPAGEGFVNNVSPGTARATSVPNYSQRWRCGSVVRFTVRAVTDLGVSAPSSAYEVRTPACPASRKLWISVDTLIIEPSAATGQVLDRGDICILCDDRRLELFGFMIPGDEGNAYGIPNPSHDFGTILFGLCPHQTICHNAGTFTTNSGWWHQLDYPILNEPLAFSVAINDYDTENAPDLFCTAMAVLAPRSPQEWSRTAETVILQSDFGEAKCRFEITVRGEP